MNSKKIEVTFDNVVTSIDRKDFKGSVVVSTPATGGGGGGNGGGGKTGGTKSK